MGDEVGVVSKELQEELATQQWPCLLCLVSVQAGTLACRARN